MKINELMIGIDCVFQSYKDVWEILKFNGIDFEEYQFSVIFENMINNLPENFAPEYFKELISKCEIFNFALFHLYLPNDKKECIVTLKDFFSSNCEMIVLISDTCYVEIYCKKRDWLEIIYKNAVNIPKSIVEIKTTDNDSRTDLFI